MHEDELLSSYNYELPESHIAQVPSIPAHSAKMMVCSINQKGDCKTKDQIFFDLTESLNDNYLLFLNRTKVFKARIPLQNIKIIRASGKELILEQGEVFVYQLLSENTFECLVSDSKNFKPGSKVQISDTIFLESQKFTENGIKFQIH